jgi:hypothetical protein
MNQFPNQYQQPLQPGTFFQAQLTPPTQIMVYQDPNQNPGVAGRTQSSQSSGAWSGQPNQISQGHADQSSHGASKLSNQVPVQAVVQDAQEALSTISQLTTASFATQTGNGQISSSNCSHSSPNNLLSFM